ncbi:unnamed protein product [Brassicogethes aeneus]|uniref:RNA helicase n=1 Tax=Brassicogethes aeneus TaxID=1431903 RepID=A0A9P0BKE5_BRAAE|nr:unnamed protein product [Brassicogethes aeneus]
MSDKRGKRGDHPKHLKGRDIGEYYKNKRRKDDGERPHRRSEDGHKKRPKDLKGKALGMYYRDKKHMSREERKEITRKNIMGTILLSERRKEEIQRILESNIFENKSKEKATDYSHVEDSVFKRDFLRIIRGNINDILDEASSELIPDHRLDEMLYSFNQNKADDFQYKLLLKKRKKLPSFEKRVELLELIEKNQVVVISGETGCGKTTQVAQFILDDYIDKRKGSTCKIICTQPRRISAISVAERVAEERSETLGGSVGYQIRLEKKLPRERGSICFCTTGVVLKQMESDPCLTGVSHLILDEIHERDVLSDFLMTIIKKVITKRKDLKLILMSATLNSEAFSKYYDNCPHINIPGFTYPVEEYYLEDVIEKTRFDFGNEYRRYSDRQNRDFSDFIEPHVRLLEKEKKYSRNTCIQLRKAESEKVNLDLIFELLLYICHKESRKGAILVFVTGFAEISNLNTLLEKSGKFPSYKYHIYPLHSQMPTAEQKQIFMPASDGTRKIIISTNIAETSITIDDVVFVIDCGKIKMTNYIPETNSQTLLPEWVSLANANQRRGRAGRVQAGVCYHLFSRARKMLLDQYQKPEILRKRLEDVILVAKMLQLGKIKDFFGKLMNPPTEECTYISLDLLHKLNALDKDENLTPLGFHLAKLPMAPQMGKMILFGAIFGCLNPVLSVAASLDFKDAFQLPLGKEKLAEQKKFELSNGWKSDHLVLFRALEMFQTTYNQRQFCRDYFLSSSTLKMLIDMKKQFMGYLHEMNFVTSLDPAAKEFNVNSDNFSLVKACICAGLYPNVCFYKRTKKRGLLRSLEYEKLEFHPKSVLSRERDFESPLFVYYLRMKSSSDFIHDGTMVYPLPLVFFGDQFDASKQVNNGKVITINNALSFRCGNSTAAIIGDLRDKLNWFLEHKICHPGFIDWRKNGEEIPMLRAIMELITSEDLGDFDSDCFDDCDSS